ncbi:MAG: protoheme IX farnesyltransferase [Deltaproteobacteria bacterium]|nr:protoheme IX farnesyltransferase [Deltaproteobacteria bacterium]
MVYAANSEEHGSLNGKGRMSVNPSYATVSQGATCTTYFSDLFSLTKPKIIALLLISTFCTMVLASGGNVSMPLVVWVLLGGALISASANAMNCILDRDIDALMQRTKNRPMAVGRLGLLSAYLFAIIAGASGFFVLYSFVGLSASLVALSGHLFYVLIYTLWLKRITAQNIVIGGVAGAIPPLVGWVAIKGELEFTALLLFLVIFFWTPPHFWALALNKNSDYKRAGIPMLPVVAGRDATLNGMLFYALCLIPTTVILVLSNEYLGWFSLLVMLSLSVVFSWKIWHLKRTGFAENVEMLKAKEVFNFSNAYLSLYFLCLVVDATLL